jgi:hypothetical protein
MANLKLDLVNKLNNDKFYEELELIRLAQDPAMNYKNKIDLMQTQLGNLALLNAELGLVEEYFKEPAPAPAQAPAQADAAPVKEEAPAPVEAPKPQAGQSHAEG